MFVTIFDDLPPDQQTAEFLGGKGAGLYWMQRQGIDVPPALIFPTSMCVKYMQAPELIRATIKKMLPQIYQFFMSECEDKIPLLSVRSGARASMPGMMDTILNVGLDGSTYDTWADRLGEKCAQDSYKRLICMYGSVAKSLPKHKLEDCQDLGMALAKYKRLAGEDFPGADDQLLNSIIAVFESWNNERAKIYRKMNNIPDDWGTAVVVQAMVFGNLNDQSGTGVLFTRNPDTGEDVVTGEFLVNAQGEDVVAGVRTPMPLSKMAEWNTEVATKLLDTVEKLEQAKNDVQDVEFTIQNGKLYILQTRTAKRSALAAVRIALEFYEEGKITRDQMLARVSQSELDMAERPVISPKFKDVPLCDGFAASSGVASGKPVFTKAEAVACAAAGVPCVLITKETTPDDLQGMIAAQGVMTMEGGSTSHAAVVARGMNKPCVTAIGKDVQFFKGLEVVSFCGATGRVWGTKVPTTGGKSEFVMKFRNLVIGDGTLMSRVVPDFKVERLILDLCSFFMEDLENVKKIIKQAQAMCNQLHVSLAKPSDFDLEVMDTFLTEQDATTRMGILRAMIDNMPASPNFRVIGYKSPVHPGFNAYDTLQDLVSATSDGVVSFQNPASARVIKWLKSEGVVIQDIGVKGGIAPWGVHAA